MEKRGFLVFVVLLTICLSLHSNQDKRFALSKGSILSQDVSDGPNIEWYEYDEAQPIEIAEDRSYTGQTIEVFVRDTWVSDANGVDTVIFRFRWDSEIEWINRSTERVTGTETRGLYRGNLTGNVVWDTVRNYPALQDGGFYFKIFANDSLGNWSETFEIHTSFGYIGIFTNTTPVEPALNLDPTTVALAIVIPIVVICVGTAAYRRRT